MKEVNIFTWDGYYTTFCYHLAEGYVSRVAWEKTEDTYQEKTGGVERYSSLESFRSALYRRLKRKK